MAGTYDGVTLTALSHVDGDENPSGVGELAYLMRYSDMATIQEPTISTSPESVLTISGTHTMKASKSPITCEPVFEKNDFESPLQGEVYSKIWNPKLTLFMAQPSIAAAGGISALKNARLIALFRRPGQTTNYQQIGGKAMAAKIAEGSVKFGKGPTGEPGIMFVLEAHSTQPFYYYTGTVPVTGV
ncbi:MAG: hypothetical protein V4619_15435 [Bacteroidota bacterium]